MNPPLPGSPFPDPEELARQRQADELRRVDLAAYFQAALFEPDLTDPREGATDAEWNEYFDKFDQFLHDDLAIPIRDYLGNPQVKPLATLEPAELEEELDRLLEFMYLNGIAIDFLCPIEDADAYRFIVDELFNEETSRARIQGSTHCFIYEEFYPNAEYDAKMEARGFVSSLLHQQLDLLEISLGNDELYDKYGNPISRTALFLQMQRFWRENPVIININVEPVSCEIEGDYAKVELVTRWTAVRTSPVDQITTTGRSFIRLKRWSDDIYWNVIQADLAGWN
jgi:hypothetical protein